MSRTCSFCNLANLLRPSRRGTRLNFADTFRNRYMLYTAVNNGHWFDSLRLSPFQTKRPDKRIAPHRGSQSGRSESKARNRTARSSFSKTTKKSKEKKETKHRTMSVFLHCQTSFSHSVSILSGPAFSVSSFVSFIVVPLANGAHFSSSLPRSNDCSRIDVSVLQGTSSSIDRRPFSSRSRSRHARSFLARF